MENFENMNNNNFNVQKNTQGNVEPINKKQKKKKKHLFLKFILFLIILFLAYKGIRFIGNSIAEKKLDAFMLEYPFTFNNEDNYKAITGDFEVKNVYTLKDKEYKVTWSSNSDCIKFDNNKAIVKNTSKQNKIVEIKANYSILGGIGKASRTFKVNVLTSNKIELKDVNVVNVNSVKDKSYNKNMKMVLTPKGDVASMYGDFNQSIYTADDCYTVLKAYKSNLGIDSACDFSLCNIMYGDDITTYIFYLTINKYNIEDKKIYVSVNNNDNFSISSIKCNFDKDISKYPKQKPQSDTVIYNLLASTYNRTKDNTIFTYNSYGYKSIDDNIYLVGDYCLIYDNDEIHEIYVDIINGKIIKEVDSSSYATDSSKYGMVSCTGTGVMGDKKYFEGYKNDNNYYLYDTERNIRIFNTLSKYSLYRLAMDNIEWYAQYKDTDNPFVSAGTLWGVLVNYVMMEADMNVGTYLTRYYITSDSNKFENNPIAVDSYYNITKAYDYYKDKFKLISYDNRGANINVYIDNNMLEDNACWNSELKSFCINPVKNFKYSLAKDCEVLGHEYTHAVFGEYISGSGTELSGLNEAYADIFGICAKGYEDWKICKNEYLGKECYVRDLTNINSPESVFSAVYDKPAPEKYHNADWEAWNGEEHAIACMIGHIAYQMHNSGKFTNTELENIWYKSLTYGYDGEDTYVTCRQQILQAMNDLNGTSFNGHTFSFSAEQRDLVRSFFDEAEIFDNTDSYECTSDAIEGDLVKDDSYTHRFAIAFSPIGFIINKAPIYIYEECKSPSKSDTEYVQNELNKSWDSIGGNDLSNELAEYFGSREGDAIIYKQIPHWQMNIVEWWIGKTNVEMGQFVEDTLEKTDTLESNEDNDWVNVLKQYIFTGGISETTRYKFYNSLLETSN